MKIGTYYYPEQWPREQWERDFDNMAALGLQIVHVGEFAWFTMEPKEGEFQFDWLSECVEMAAKRRMEVILCTPTASPPIWLVEKYPDVLPVDDAGRRKRFGGRRHYSPTSPAMMDAARRITSALAERFGDHPAVIGWQIDNEYSSDFIDQNPHAAAAFGGWLREKYGGSVEALNKAWGCQFWNTYYTDFAQVKLPLTREVKYGNPHQVLDAARFWSWAFAQFNKVQADALRPKIGNRFVTTNFMPFHPDVNPSDMAADLNFMAWDAYPCPGNEKSPTDQNYRLGDPAQMGFMHDYMASFHHRWGLMELQPGQVNWGDTPVHLYPGAVRLWLWTALAHGAEFTTTYRYRQPRFGVEMFHQGLVGTDGTTPTVGGRQFQLAIDEIKRVKTTASETAATVSTPAPGAAGGTEVGLVFDFEQLWEFGILPQSKRWDYARLIRLWYGAFARLGLGVRVLRPGQEWPAELPVIVAPGLQMVGGTLVDQMTKYAATGGHLVLTCRTALMDRTGQLFEGPLASPILPLIGGSIEAYDGLPEGATAQVEMDGKKYPWGVWGDLLYGESETKTIARYADQFYAGAAAVIQNRYQGGLVTYCGVFGEEAFTDALAERIATQSKLAITPLPARVHLLRRGPYRILLNFTTDAVDAPAPPRTRFLVGTRKVDGAGVAVWREG
ncbi:MAG: Beta-galactosidase [Phycisphaerales bacterium]|nr:Beta-galactosidase [Phycisphaerales bacterium]